MSDLRSKEAAAALLAVGREDYRGGPLNQSAQEGDGEMVAALLDQGAAVDAPNGDGWTALIHCAVNGHEAVAETLLEAGANVNHTAGNGSTPLIFACINSRPALVRLLLRFGAVKGHVNGIGHNAAAYANKAINAILDENP